jgi:DNA topoisomerase-1
VALPKHSDPAEITFEEAKELLSLPKELGDHPETGEPVLLMTGRFGPYVKSGTSSHSIGKTPLTEITLEKALELLKKKKKKGKKSSSKKKS